MAIDTAKVLVGAPMQSGTTGAVQYADVGTDLPADARTAWAAGTSCGYVSEDGLTLTAEYSTVDIKDWSKNTVRTLLEEFTGEISFSFIQTDYEGLCVLFGEDHVHRTPATSAAGETITIDMGAHLAPARTFVFNMKDGDARMRVVVPNGQPVLDGDLTFVANEPIKWNVKIVCSVDGAGERVYIHTDDGVVSA
ncbi:Uncharacterised protein [Slackia heliotrinireducens]|uniref:Major tail protein n=1 Tax=Slackia heliotrinireducens (strain ATCC 29202 / DSM 20476 / NCTC 11029 / RHS 1) TaxID=471855 RepID=C7N6N4_SLAHD|nr:hypothetical protein [Slackia heliotrinireducens]ACV22569.1 hypothetical protein Shel_15500 [Slackia heliotrinireducens DSM 20476]VEH01049.1 Uncharacterised protein [Slackia heliotrinireducens]